MRAKGLNRLNRINRINRINRLNRLKSRVFQNTDNKISKGDELTQYVAW